MKKILSVIICLSILCSCQTQEKIKRENEEKNIKKIKENIDKEKIPETTKEWKIDTKTKKVLTIICTNKSKKCKDLKNNVNKIKEEIKIYYIEIDNLTEEEKEIYKTTYTLNDYTGYLPYIMLTDKDKLINTKTDIYKLEDLEKIIKKEQ